MSAGMTSSPTPGITAIPTRERWLGLGLLAAVLLVAYLLLLHPWWTVPMLDLQTRVHLDEIEFAVFVEILNRTDAEIAELLNRFRGDAADLGAVFCVERG